MINLKQQSSSVFQFCVGRMSGVVCPSFVLFFGFLLLSLFTKPGDGIILHWFMSISEHGLETETWGLQCMQFESPATISILNYFFQQTVIFLFRVV